MTGLRNAASGRQVNNMVNFLSRVVVMSTPLLLGSIAEVYAERTGMMICAIEGIFLIGAWGGFVGTYLTGSQLLGLLMAMGCGLIMAALYGLITVFMKQQQVVTGTALQILSAGFCSFFRQVSGSLSDQGNRSSR